MREHKYKAWNTVKKVMYSAKELGADQETLSVDGRGFSNTRLSEFHTHLLPLEYTGLKDKNEVEIYEGDIIETVSELMTNFGETPTGKYQTTHLSIEYDEARAQFKERDLITKYLKPLGLSQHIVSQYSEVIGTIYENPELLAEV